MELDNCKFGFTRKQTTMKIESIYKRDFTKKTFYPEKITDAILKAMISVDKGDVKAAEKISNEV